MYIESNMPMVVESKQHRSDIWVLPSFLTTAYMDWSPKGNTDYPTIHHWWPIGRPKIFNFGQHCQNLYEATMKFFGGSDNIWLTFAAKKAKSDKKTPQ